MTAIRAGAVLTLHREGRMAWPSLRALGRAVGRAADAGIAVDVVLVLDRADAATRAVVTEATGTGVLERAAATELLAVDLGDPGLSRLAGIEATSAPYVGIVDGDDLVSGNWITASVARLAASAAPVVVHPEYGVNFGEFGGVWRLMESVDPDFRLEVFYEGNYWPSTCFAPRTVFETHPYEPAVPTSGLGPEDWHWNVETLLDGIEHVVAPDACLYYRRKPSESRDRLHRHSLLPPTRLLRDRTLLAGSGRLTPDAVAADLLRAGLEDLDLPPEDRAGVVDPAWAERFGAGPEELAALRPEEFNVAHYRVLHLDLDRLGYGELVRHYLAQGRAEGRAALVPEADLALLAGVGFDPADYVRTRLGRPELPARAGYFHYLHVGRHEGSQTRPIELPTPKAIDMPEAVLTDWRDVHRLEPAIYFPSRPVLDALPVQQWPPRPAGPRSDLYARLLSALPDRLDAVLLAPDLSSGGGALAVRYAEAIRAQRPDWSVVLLASGGDAAVDGVRVVDLARLVGGGQPEAAVWQRVVGTLLVQLAPSLFHVVEAELGFDLVETYGAALGAIDTRIFLTTAEIGEHEVLGAVSPLFKRPADYLAPVAGVLTTAWTAERLHAVCGYERSSLLAHDEIRGNDAAAFARRLAAISGYFAPVGEQG